MFKCAITGKVTEPKVPQTKVVTKTRECNYVNYKWDEETGDKVRIESKGWEIVTEINVSPEGMKILEAKANG